MNHHDDEVAIPGYNLFWDLGRTDKRRQNSRVVVYVREGLTVTPKYKYMEDYDTIPSVWLELGHKGTRKSLACFLYREYKPWKAETQPNGEDGSSIQAQKERWKSWLRSKEHIFMTKQEVWVLGDINLDLTRGEGYRNKAMVDELQNVVMDKGWTRLVTGPTHYEHRVNGDIETTIDVILTNVPERCPRHGVLEVTSSDHGLVWMERKTKMPMKRPKETMKRMRQYYNKEDLVLAAEMTDWGYFSGDEEEVTSKDKSDEVTAQEVEKRAAHLANCVTGVMEAVAPMRKIKLKRGVKKWISTDILEMRRMRERLRNRARRTKRPEHFEEWKKTRRMVAKMIRDGRKRYLEKRLQDAMATAATPYRGVAEYLGWDEVGAPESLQCGDKMETGAQEMADGLKDQYIRKIEEVKKALGEPAGDYLDRVRRLTVGNTGIFEFKEVLEEEVTMMIKQVDSKESFGPDLISYGDLKKLSKYVTKPLCELINASLKASFYPTLWKGARIKPVWKGKGNDRQQPKSYRPVALLSACGRVMEALLAKQVDEYARQRSIHHSNVHGFRKGHGTDTALLECWEHVLDEIEKGRIVAMCLLDVSAGFDSVPHVNLLRKLECYGYGDRALRWFSSYLKERTQKVVVEASESKKYTLDRGIPQGGPLCPALWREYVNDLPEECKIWGGSLVGETGEDWEETSPQRETSPVSQMVDTKPEHELSLEEKYDQQMRKTGRWPVEKWRRERTGVGPDRLRVKAHRDPDDGMSTLYADDAATRDSASTWEELETRMEDSLTRMCGNMVGSRLKVNPDKTDFIILASPAKRMAMGGLEVTKVIGGVEKKPSQTVKSLGVYISRDLTWRDQTREKLSECRNKMRGLWKVQTSLPVSQRKQMAEAIIISRLTYCLETVSTGRVEDLTALQYMLVQAARWVLGRGKMGWSTTTNFKRLGWLTMPQWVAYKSIRTGIKILQNKEPESLYRKLTAGKLVTRGEGMVHEVRTRRLMTSQDLSDMKTSTKKAWSTRTVRWLALLPPAMLGMDSKKPASKKMLKRWVTENIPTTGDRILWGKPGEGGRREAGDPLGPSNPPDQGDGGGGKKKQARERREAQKTEDESQKKGLERWLLGVGQVRGQQRDQKLEEGLAACPTSSLAAVVSTSHRGSRGRFTATWRNCSGNSGVKQMVTSLLLCMVLRIAEQRKDLDGWWRGVSQAGGRQGEEKQGVGWTACLASSLAAVVSTSQRGSRGRCSARRRTCSGNSGVKHTVTSLLLCMVLRIAEQRSCGQTSCGGVTESGGQSVWTKVMNSDQNPVKTGVG